MPIPDGVLRLSDGRTLAWDDYGDPGGVPVLAFHGAPSSRLDFAPLSDTARRLGVRIVAPDRPGIGGSSPQPGRTLLGWADDVTALADHLGFDRFGVLGFSGGGPYGLAYATARPDRVDVVVGASAAAPIDHPGGRNGMSIDDRLLTTLSLRTRRLAEAWMWVMVTAARTAPGLVVKGQGAVLSSAAGAALESLGRPSQVLAPFYESARQGPAGPVEDFAIVSRPFGFGLAQVPGRVRLFHGTADRVVPLEHARHLARLIPGAELTEVPDGGHLMLYTESERLLGALTPDHG